MQRYPSGHSKILHFQFWICRYQRPLLRKYSPSIFALAEVRLLPARIYELLMSYKGFHGNIELEDYWNFETLYPKYKIEIHLRQKRRNHHNKRANQCEFIKWSMNKSCSNANIEQIETSFDQGSTVCDTVSLIPVGPNWSEISKICLVLDFSICFVSGTSRFGSVNPSLWWYLRPKVTLSTS